MGIPRRAGCFYSKKNITPRGSDPRSRYCFSSFTGDTGMHIPGAAARGAAATNHCKKRTVGESGNVLQESEFGPETLRDVPLPPLLPSPKYPRAAESYSDQKFSPRSRKQFDPGSCFDYPLEECRCGRRHWRFLREEERGVRC